MIANLIAGHWGHPHTPALPVYNPATADVLDEVPLSGPAEVRDAVTAAAEAYSGWAQTPVLERTRLMFRYKALLEAHSVEGVVLRGPACAWHRRDRVLYAQEDVH